MLSETLRKNVRPFLQIVKRGLSLPNAPMMPDHWKLSLMTVESISEDMRFFYNFIRILRQQHLRSSTALFQGKGSKRRMP